MKPTTDYELIRSIIERPDIMPTFCGGCPTDEAIEDKRLIWFYQEDVGFLAVNMNGKYLIFHAAIPTENRGKKALDAARELATNLTSNGYIVMTKVFKDELHIKSFVRLVGFEKTGESEAMNYYTFGGA